MSTMPRDNLARALYVGGVELRDADTEDPKLVGHFAVTNEWAEIRSIREGHFLERLAPGAFVKTFRERGDKIKCLFNHGKDPQIGQKPLGVPERLDEDNIGAAYSVPLLNAHYVRELVPGLQAGAYGASFLFKSMREKVDQRPQRSEYNPQGITERTVVEAFVYEFGPCVFGAYDGATAGVRSITDLLEDVDAVARATPVLLDDTRMNHARAFISRDIPDDDRRAEARSARRYDRICEYVGDTVWAIHPPALMTIIDIVGERSAGYIPSDEEIRERIGPQVRMRDQAPDESSVAVIDISGTIIPKADMIDNASSDGTSIESLKADIRSALGSEDVKAILLNIDSPGGSVDLVPEMASEIRAARGGKPIVALANTFAASAAYWLASAADEIVVTPSGQVGSIGVYNAHQDKSQLQEKLGVKTTLVSAGKYKVEGNPFEPLSEDAQAEMQKRVDAYYDMFVGAVAKGRGTDVATVKSEYGEGRMMMAPDAVEAGMADRIATFDETLARLEREAKKASATTSKAAATADMLDHEPVTKDGDTAPPVDGAEASQPHPVRGRRDNTKSYLRKDKPSWQL
jgi:signal peptide peptidase SppA